MDGDGVFSVEGHVPFFVEDLFASLKPFINNRLMSLEATVAELTKSQTESQHFRAQVVALNHEIALW